MKIDFWQKQRTDILWCFVIFAFGIGCYFGLPQEPNLFALTTACALILGWVIWKKHLWACFVLFFFLGLTVATGRTFFTHTKFLKEPLLNQTISGQVTKAYSTHAGQTILLNNVHLKNSDKTLNAVRVSMKKGYQTIQTGDLITLTGNLNPPNSHQQLRYFYQGIEAKSNTLQVIEHHPNTSNFWDTLRIAIKDRLQQHLSKTQTQIAIPLVTGEQQVVSSKLYAIYRKAGIAHILSVSGFHMALLAGFIFFLIRGLFVFFPKHYPLHAAKKVAAVMAFGATCFYLFLSGCQVPALRSFMMITLVLIGVFIDRKTVSLYNLLLVAFVILLFHPEWITSVSFQLSFTAVMVLVGLFEDITIHIPRLKFIHLFLGAIVANMLITLALAPFVAYHFHVFNPYGILGNLFTSLLFSCIVMPLLFIGVLLMPLHMEALFIKGAGLGLELITAIAKKIATLPYSNISIPSFSAWALGCISLGLCFLCLVKTNKRALGFVMITAGIIIALAFQPQSNLVINNHTVVTHQQNDLFTVKGEKTTLTTRHKFDQDNTQSDRPWISSIQLKQTERKEKICKKNILSASASF